MATRGGCLYLGTDGSAAPLTLQSVVRRVEYQPLRAGRTSNIKLGAPQATFQDAVKVLRKQSAMWIRTGRINPARYGVERTEIVETADPVEWFTEEDLQQ